MHDELFGAVIPPGEHSLAFHRMHGLPGTGQFQFDLDRRISYDFVNATLSMWFPGKGCRPTVRAAPLHLPARRAGGDDRKFLVFDRFAPSGLPRAPGFHTHIAIGSPTNLTDLLRVADIV